MPKLELGNEGTRDRSGSFPDKGVPKLELGNEGKLKGVPKLELGNEGK